jgi:hypothetical protein
MVSWVIVRAWEEARAQAGAEIRRARAEVAREIRRQMDGGWAAGPGASWWWWPAAGHRAWGAMRGPRPGSARPAALPGSTPLRRVMQAAWAGGVRGGAEGRDRARQRRDVRHAARAAGTTQSRRAARSAAAGAGYAAGRWWPWQSGPSAVVRMRACDDCGAACADTALKLAPREVGGHTEFWLLCAACRADNEAAAPPADADARVPAASELPAPGPTLEPGAAWAIPDGWDVPGTPVSAAGLRRGDLVLYLGAWRAVLGFLNYRPSTGRPAADSDVIADLGGGTIAEVTAAQVVVARPAAGIAGPEGFNMTLRSRSGQVIDPFAGNGRSSGTTTIAVWTLEDLGRRLALAAADPDYDVTVEKAPTTEELTAPTEELEEDIMPTGTTPAVTAGGGESYTHGAWNQATAGIHQRLAAGLPQALEVMLASLNSADAGRTQVSGVMGLADAVQSWAAQVRSMLAEVNARELPVTEAVSAAGGPDEVAGIPYLSEV